MHVDRDEYDYIIIGSGFGGAVAAYRLAQKGYRVLVLEKGRRYRTQDFPKTNWNLKKSIWMPKLGLFGIQALTLLRHVMVLHGTGVGGGSLVYANQLIVPKEEIFLKDEWGIKDMQSKLQAHFSTAQRMLGAVDCPGIGNADEVLKKVGLDVCNEDTFHINPVGIFFGEPEKEVPDPYFDGAGPSRTGCKFCGACMIGCPVGAKNTLDKNYLYLAEKMGVEIVAEREAIRVIPDAEAYRVITRSPGLRLENEKE